MTLDLDALQVLIDSTTPGPWFLLPELCGPEGQGVYNEDGGLIVEVGDPYPRGDNHPQQNMAFIATARTAMPELLAEVRRVRADLMHARQSANIAHDRVRKAEWNTEHFYDRLDAVAAPSDGWKVGDPVPSS